MNNIFFTSDLHLCHDREFLYKPRGFECVADMNEAILENWNKIIDDNDTIYINGDIMLNDNEEGMRYWNTLKGKKYIILGNHDTDKRIDLFYNAPNTEILGYSYIIKEGKWRIYLSHYPTITTNVDEAHLNQHLFNFYGHTHQKTNFYNDIPWFYHVGMDSHNCTPIEISDIKSECRKKYDECGAML